MRQQANQSICGYEPEADVSKRGLLKANDGANRNAHIALDQDYLMQDFLKAAKFLLLDLASTICFLIFFLLTHNTVLSVALGTALGLVQIAIPLIRRQPVHTLEWLSLFLVIAAGTATILTDDPRIMLFKPSVIYAVVGIAMLKAGWIIRYLPPIARTVAPDVAVAVGYTWAIVMFVTAAVNALVAVSYGVQTWAMVMLIFGIGSKAAVFIAGFLAIRLTTVRRVRAMPAEKREALLASM
jgi:intracellular septation protein